MKVLRILLFLVSVSVQLVSVAQISSGGTPRRVNFLKSMVLKPVDMPELDNVKLFDSSVSGFRNAVHLKPFQFAHPFFVGFNPLNSGSWGESEDGFQVWQLEIRSKGAYSLNLKFEGFDLPPDSRVFIFDASRKHILGAFTSSNNPPSGIFPVSPVAGDYIFVQYEIPPDAEREIDFTITRVNHDFVDILKGGDRRPLGILAGNCNLDINCGPAAHWAKVKEAVCRIIIDGIEVCTGTLLNNTKEDKTPYVLTANHCVNDHGASYSSVFLFNYESPYCGSLDGDVTNSISGSVLKAGFDSLDFALLQLSTVPPPAFRPFYAGWNHSGAIPDSVATIHHPQGDIKKIAIDRNSPVIATYSSEYTKSGFWKTLKWEFGTTEAGSSGAPYFNSQLQFTGSLTGGAANCSNSVNDYFARFDKAWDYRPEAEKQLKYWLDPGNKGVKLLEGRNFYSGMDFCNAFTNLVEGDRHQVVKLISPVQKVSGYWTGTNGEGYTEFVEKFCIKGNEAVQGVSLGVGIVKLKQAGTESKVTIKVYEGDGEPKTEIYSQQVKIRDLTQDAMNYIKFSQSVAPVDTFFVGYDVSQVLSGDTIALYQTLRNGNVTQNSFMLKKNGTWLKFMQANSGNKASALVCQVLACNVDTLTLDPPLVDDSLGILLYPNPFIQSIELEAGDLFDPDNVSVYDLVGHRIRVKISTVSQLKVKIDFSGNVPGIYLVRLRDNRRNITRKVAYFPRQ